MRSADGRRLVVRNGQARERTVTCGAGTWYVRALRVNDKRVDADGARERFTSRILPPYMRCPPHVAEVLPLLYLRGLATSGRRVPSLPMVGRHGHPMLVTHPRRAPTLAGRYRPMVPTGRRGSCSTR